MQVRERARQAIERQVGQQLGLCRPLRGPERPAPVTALDPGLPHQSASRLREQRMPSSRSSVWIRGA
jgi:hypothetical protein